MIGDRWGVMGVRLNTVVLLAISPDISKRKNVWNSGVCRRKRGDAYHSEIVAKN